MEKDVEVKMKRPFVSIWVAPLFVLKTLHSSQKNKSEVWDGQGFAVSPISVGGNYAFALLQQAHPLPPLLQTRLFRGAIEEYLENAINPKCSNLHAD